MMHQSIDFSSIWDSPANSPKFALGGYETAHDFDALFDDKDVLGYSTLLDSNKSSVSNAAGSPDVSSGIVSTALETNGPSSLLQMLARPQTGIVPLQPSAAFASAHSCFANPVVQQQPFSKPADVASSIFSAPSMMTASDTAATTSQGSASSDDKSLMEVAAAAKLSRLIAAHPSANPASKNDSQSALQSLLTICFAPPAPSAAEQQAPGLKIFENITMEDVDRLRELVRANTSTGVFSQKEAAATEPAPTVTSRGRTVRTTSNRCKPIIEDPDVPLTTQEKNRAAQRRFRMRQKAKISDMEQQVDELLTQLKRAHAENSSLKNLNNILEQVLNLRDEHINGLQQAVHVLNPAGCKRPSFEMSGELELQPGTGHHDAAQPAAPSSSLEEYYPSGPLSADKFPAERMRAMSSEEALTTYKDFLARIAANMQVLEEQVPSPQVVHVMLELGGFIERICMFRPQDLWRLMSCDMETGRPAEAVPVKHWERLLSKLQLTPEQKEAVLAARTRVLGQLNAILEERRQLAAQLAQASLPRGEDYLHLGKAALDSHGVQEALAGNVMREHNCYMEFGIFCFKKVLTLVQNAKCWLHAYPFYPDRMAMANLLAAEAEAVQQQQGAAAIRPKVEPQDMSWLPTGVVA